MNEYFKNDKKLDKSRLIVQDSLEFSGQEAIAILTEWDHFKEIEYPRESIIFDGRRVLNVDESFYSIDLNEIRLSKFDGINLIF